jgi:hypothetical protein
MYEYIYLYRGALATVNEASMIATAALETKYSILCNQLQTRNDEIKSLENQLNSRENKVINSQSNDNTSPVSFKIENNSDVLYNTPSKIHDTEVLNEVRAVSTNTGCENPQDDSIYESPSSFYRDASSTISSHTKSLQVIPQDLDPGLPHHITPYLPQGLTPDLPQNIETYIDDINHENDEIKLKFHSPDKKNSLLKHLLEKRECEINDMLIELKSLKLRLINDTDIHNDVVDDYEMRLLVLCDDLNKTKQNLAISQVFMTIFIYICVYICVKKDVFLYIMMLCLIIK